MNEEQFEISSTCWRWALLLSAPAWALIVAIVLALT